VLFADPLVNAFALAVGRPDFYAKAGGKASVIYVGSKTGRDGITAQPWRAKSSEGSEQNVPTSRWAIHFWKKRCWKLAWKPCIPGRLSAYKTWARRPDLFHVRDGRAAAAWIEIELDLVPQRETGMNAYEIMPERVTERMLLVAEMRPRKKFCASLEVGFGSVIVDV